MGRFDRCGWLLVVAVVVAAGIVEKADAATYLVGDTMRWTVPSSPTAYSDWASQYVFRAGDVLVFNFTTGQHDAAQVTKAAFDGCSSTSPIALSTVGPWNTTLTSTGEHYYICTFGSHCNLGQKLAINVTGTASPAPAPAPSTPIPTPTPAPAPSTPIPTPTPAPAPSTPTPTPTPSPSPSGSPSPTPGSAPTPMSPGGSPSSPGGSGEAPSSTSTPGAGDMSPPSPPPPPPSAATMLSTASGKLAIFGLVALGIMM